MMERKNEHQGMTSPAPEARAGQTSTGNSNSNLIATGSSKQLPATTTPPAEPPNQSQYQVAVLDASAATYGMRLKRFKLVHTTAQLLIKSRGERREMMCETAQVLMAGLHDLNEESIDILQGLMSACTNNN